MKPEGYAIEIGWTDQHGVSGHLFLGDVNDYAPSLDGPLDPSVVGVVEVKPPGDDFEWMPVYLDRAHAEHMLAALRTMLGKSS